MRPCTAAAFAITLAVLPSISQGAAPPAPTNCSALPNYGNNHITVSCDAAPGATHYRVYRDTSSNPATRTQIAYEPAPAGGGTFSYEDSTGLSNTTEYYYTVRAHNGDGDSGDSNEFQQNLKTIWPVATSHELLHTWNDTEGKTGDVWFHEGVDIQKGHNATHVQVTAARGGYATEGNHYGGGDYLVIRVRVGADEHYYMYNHMQVRGADHRVYRAGEVIGEIDDTLFLVEYGHCHYAINDAPHSTSPRWTPLDIHPLSVFSANADKDPVAGNKRPGMKDLMSDGKIVYFAKNNEADKTKVLDYDPAKPMEKPIGGDIDIFCEISDEQGTNPEQLPCSVSYWIEGLRVSGDKWNNVKSDSHPYMLYDWTARCFANPERANKKLTQFFSPWFDYGATVVSNGVNYKDIAGGYSNYKYAIITNTCKETGAHDDVDKDQYWNTNAKHDASIGPEDGAANFATKPTTVKPWEARFQDGEYKVHLTTGDLVDVHEDVFVVRLENYPPMVNEVYVYEDSDNNAATPADGEHAGCERLIYEFKHVNPDPFAVALTDTQKAVAGSGKGDRKVWVKVVFSEPMDKTVSEVKLDPQGTNAGEAAISAEPGTIVWSKTYSTDDTVVALFKIVAKKSATMDSKGDLGADPGDHTCDCDIVIKGKDLPDRASAQRGLDSDGDGASEGDSIDRNHKIKIDTKHDEKPELHFKRPT